MEISKSQPRKIAYVITLPDLGGAQSHLYEVMVNIREYGYKPFLITGRRGWLTKRLSDKGICCYIVSDLVRPISPMHDMKAVKQIKNILQQEQPDIVHCHSSKAGIIGRIAAHWCQIPTVFTAHGWAFTDGVNLLKRKIYAFIENLVGYWTDRIICVSEYDRRLGMHYLPAHKGKMLTIHNCIPDVPDRVRDWQKHPVGEVINIIVVARFSPPKKNIQILHLLREMLDKGYRLTVTFVGDGPQLSIAKEEACNLQLGKEVEFLGARTDVAELLPQYDLLLLLSNWEGFPISILEGMRAGLPVFASDVGGVKEAVVNDENGVLIDAQESNIEDIVANKEKLEWLGSNGRERYLKFFKTRNMMKKLNGEYQKIYKEQHG